MCTVIASCWEWECVCRSRFVSIVEVSVSFWEDKSVPRIQRTLFCCFFMLKFVTNLHCNYISLRMRMHLLEQIREYCWSFCQFFGGQKCTSDLRDAFWLYFYAEICDKFALQLHLVENENAFVGADLWAFLKFLSVFGRARVYLESEGHFLVVLFCWNLWQICTAVASRWEWECVCWSRFVSIFEVSVSFWEGKSVPRIRGTLFGCFILLKFVTNLHCSCISLRMNVHLLEQIREHCWSFFQFLGRQKCILDLRDGHLLVVFFAEIYDKSSLQLHLVENESASVRADSWALLKLL